MSSVSSARSKKIDPLSRKTPQNPKFKNVRSQIDTGASVTKYMEKLDDIRNNYKFRKDEIFKRMKVTTFVHLVMQVYQIEMEENFEFNPPDTPYTDRPDTGDAEVANAGGQRSPTMSLPVTESDYGGSQAVPDTARSTLFSVARGVGELDLNGPQSKAAPLTPDLLPYLLLDVRDSDEFESCHIIGAINYPKSYLSRATNYEIKIMHSYCNKPGKVVIVYDEDERIATNAAQTLVQRGYDNLFMLSGGMKVAYKLFPDGLFTGSLPPTITGTKARNEQRACKDTFDQEDINKLEIYLDSHLTDNSSGCRLSKASTASSRMSGTSSVATARSTTSNASGRPAFR